MRTAALLLALLSTSACSQNVTINVSFPKLNWPGGITAPVIIQLPKTTAPLKNVFPANYDAAEACQTVEIDSRGNLEVTLPPRFPNAERQEYIRENYRLNCPTFTIEKISEKTLTVKGLSLPQFSSILKKDYDNFPYLLRAANASLGVAEGYSLQIVTVKDESPRKDLVVVARQSGEVPVALVFNGNAQPMRFDPSKSLEVFWKASYTLPWGRMAYNHNDRLIQFDMAFPFPYK